MASGVQSFVMLVILHQELTGERWEAVSSWCSAFSIQRRSVYSHSDQRTRRLPLWPTCHRAANQGPGVWFEFISVFLYWCASSPRSSSSSQRHFGITLVQTWIFFTTGWIVIIRSRFMIPSGWTVGWGHFAPTTVQYFSESSNTLTLNEHCRFCMIQ